MRSVAVRWASTFLILFVGTNPIYASECSPKDLAWMAGSWQNANNPHGAQERWVIAPHDALMGSAWELPADKPGFAEVMSIRQDGDSTFMVLRHFDGALKRAWEDKDAPMIFQVASCSAFHVVFDGQGDRAGEHMSYFRKDDHLTITGDFIHAGKTTHMEWPMVLSKE